MLVCGTRADIESVRSAVTIEASANVALPLNVASQETDPYRLAPHRIRRCTFRRLIQVELKDQRVYDVECLYPDRKIPIPIGDLDAAMPVCNACTAAHIFRPDED
ncbi:MAG: hypothetical protein A2V84_09150 [Chloroflexi bacterium RBG_16_70_13]|nr:MAG: hypothetical protein A2V84_09150 [Chloroflexi bacterium RBG_16_70_13]